MTASQPGQQFSGRTIWIQKLKTPLREFLRTETGGASVLLSATIAALVWVNVDASSYDALWGTTLSTDVGGAGVALELRHWVNSGLMTFFFFVVGLEARREFDLGNPLVIMGERLSEAVDVRPGQKVLDIATGSGNTAISAARRFCEAHGIDYIPDLIEQAKERARGRGSRCRLRRRGRGEPALPRRLLRRGALHGGGDVHPRPGEGGTGAAQGLQARRQDRAGQLGSRTAMWATCSALSASTSPLLPASNRLPSGAPRTGCGSSWATGVSSLDTTRRTYVFRYLSAAHFIEHFRSYYGPDAQGVRFARRGRARGAGERPRGAHRGLEHLRQTRRLILPSDDLEVVAVRR